MTSRSCKARIRAPGHRRSGAVHAFNAALALLVVSGSLGACRQIVGVESRRSGSDRPGQSAACLDCVTSSCSAESAACADSETCTDRASCLDSCDGAGAQCEASCTLQSGGAPYDALADFTLCRASLCSAACNLRCGNVPPLVPPLTADACQTCLAEACCDTLTACGTSPDCRRIIECTRSRVTPDGIQGCQRLLYPSAADTYAAVEACMLGSCAFDCAYGNNWSCVGSVSFPRPTVDQLTFTVRVLDAAQQPLSGIQALACVGSDPACSNPADEAMSGADGRATLHVDAVSSLGRAPFDGIVRLSDPGGGRLVTLVNTFPPLSEPGIEFPAIVPTAGDLDSIASLLKETVDPARGQILATTFDCVYRRAPGLHLTVSPPDEQAHVYYTLGTIPARNATQTDSSGNALVVNAPTGLVTLVATTEDGTVVSRTPVFVAPGSVSIAAIAPTPR